MSGISKLGLFLQGLGVVGQAATIARSQKKPARAENPVDAPLHAGEPAPRRTRKLSGCGGCGKKES